MLEGVFEWGPRIQRGPLFIGILNVTPDSFSDGGRFLSTPAALEQAKRLAGTGAGMLDLGAESTRPGATPVSASGEWARLEPVLEALRSELPALPLSLDTRHTDVAERGLALGVSVLNDITGFSDPAMLDLARRSSCGLIAMRSRMRDGVLWMPEYGGPGEGDDTLACAELAAVRDRVLAAGIHQGRVLLDPGFGFGTTFSEDTAMWEGLATLPHRLGWPAEAFCIGISRKRFLAWKAGTPNLPPDRRDDLTRAAQKEAASLGLHCFRTHRI